MLAARVVTYRRVEMAINSFAPYRSLGVDGIFPALLEGTREVVIPYLLRIFRACLSTGYVPAILLQVKVMFIPKPVWNSYSRPRDYRPIILTSFLLKTLEKFVDRYLGDEALAIMLFNPNQHAYQAGKSVETSLHQLVVRVE
jgi:vacuolar-type H+-ATPase subunit F/Vma7